MAFADAAVQNGLAVADKSVIISNSLQTAKYLAREYREAGYPVKAVLSSETLGVRTQLLPCRDMRTLRARWASFRSRVQRISVLSKFTKQAANLFRAHVAVGLFGSSTIGIDPKQQRLLVQAGSKAAGRHGMQPCPITVCALTYRQLPSVTPVTQLFSW